MQNERGTPRTLQHRLTCEDVIWRSLPALCTTRLISGAVRDRGGVFCLSWCLQTARYLHINMAFCTLGFALFKPMHKKQKEEDLKSFKTNEEIISTSEKNLLLSS